MTNEQSAITIDERYRSYGKPQFSITLDEQGPAYSLPYRSAQSGYKYLVPGPSGPEPDSRTAGSDYLIFGKLDQTDFLLGPFAEKDADVVARQWAFLRTKPPKRTTGGFFARLAKAIISLPGDLVNSVINYSLDIQLVDEILDPYDVVSEHFYKKGIDALGSPRYYMSDILKDLYNAETTAHSDYVDPGALTPVSPIRYALRHKVLDLDDKYGTKAHDVFIEIGNEPNAFPAIPPGLYAEYYGKYWEFIQNEVTLINADRSEGQKIRARVMPGGMLVMDGLPRKLLSYLRRGFTMRVEILGVDYFHLNTQTFTNVWEYWSIFAAAVNKQEREIIGTETYRVMNSSRGGRGVSATTATRNVYQNSGLKNRVSVVNLHFYPYFGPRAETIPYPTGTNVPPDPFGMLDRYVPRDPAPASARPGALGKPSLSYDPEILRYDENIVKSQLAYLRLMSVLMARSLKSWDPADAGVRDVWLTEVGNLTSVATNTAEEADQALSKVLVSPLFDVLNEGYLQFRDDSAGSNPKFMDPEPALARHTRWYWFKQSGIDNKFLMLEKSLPAIGWVQFFHDYFTWAFAAAFLTGTHISISDVPNGVEQILEDMTAAWKKQVPVTALEESEDLTAIGREYMQKAGYPFDVTIIEAVGAADTFTESAGIPQTATETINI